VETRLASAEVLRPVARRLTENAGVAFMGDIKAGPFEIPGELARSMIASPNPDGRSNADVMTRWANGLDLSHRWRDMWIVDFGLDMPESEAALFEDPFEYVRQTCGPYGKGRTQRAAGSDGGFTTIDGPR
jgi:hypothetical protein